MRRPARLPDLTRYQEAVDELWGVPRWDVLSVTAAAGVGRETLYLADATAGAFNLTLPLASTAPQRIYGIKKVDAGGNAVGFARSGADTIDGSTSHTTTTQYATVWVISNGLLWYRLIV